MKDFGDSVKRNIAFFEICRQAKNPKLNEQDRDPKVQFFKQCIKENSVAFPIMNKIFQGNLMIRNFKINLGIARAIEAQLVRKNDQVKKLYLEKNGLDNGALTAIILDGVKSQQGFNNLTIQENTLDEACIEPIAVLLKNRVPLHLEDLHL